MARSQLEGLEFGLSERTLGQLSGILV